MQSPLDSLLVTSVTSVSISCKTNKFIGICVFNK